MPSRQSMWATLIFSGTAALFAAMAIATLWHLRWVRRLPTLETFTAADQPASLLPDRTIRCSVVIAARNEEARIEQTIRHLFAQRGVEAEFIVVDDRSSDRTSEILRELAKEDSRVRVKRVDVLPDGWLGKCHACHVGAGAATRDWILFTDAAQLDVCHAASGWRPLARHFLSAGNLARWERAVTRLKS